MDTEYEFVFPMREHVRQDGDTYAAIPGICIRDYFAVRIANGLLAGNSHFSFDMCGTKSVANDVAATAYEIADAMLAHRNAKA